MLAILLAVLRPVSPPIVYEFSFDLTPPPGTNLSPETYAALVYSPWTKYCGMNPTVTPPMEVCFTVSNVRLDIGPFVAGVTLVQEDGKHRVLRVTLPLGVRVEHAASITLDEQPAIVAPYTVCLSHGCIADMEVDDTFIGNLKTGRALSFSGINLIGEPVYFRLLLAGFAQAIEGPGVDLAVPDPAARRMRRQ